MANRIPVSDQYVSSALQPGLSNQSWHVQINEEATNENNRRKWRYFWVGTKKWQYSHKPWDAHVNKSIMYVTARELKATFNMSSRKKKTPKAKRVGFMHMWITSNCFSHSQLGWYVEARENFAYLSSYAKASVPVKSIIPCTYLLSSGVVYHCNPTLTLIMCCTRLH